MICFAVVPEGTPTEKALPILTKGEGRIIDLKNVRRLDGPEMDMLRMAVPGLQDPE